MTPVEIVNAIKILVAIFPEAMKLFQMWKNYHQQQLHAANAKKLTADIKSAVSSVMENKSAGTAGLENLIKDLGKPQVVPSPNP
jgi:chemotaxis regulatin CheY-phosphate phosphatase CheZ